MVKVEKIRVSKISLVFGIKLELSLVMAFILWGGYFPKRLFGEGVIWNFLAFLRGTSDNTGQNLIGGG